MKLRWAVILLMLLLPWEVWACPGCTYERMLLSNWYQKTWVIKLIAAALFTFNRLDVVRVIYVFFAYIWAYIKLYDYLVWFGHPAVSDGIVGTLSRFGLGLLELNILDLALLFFLGRIRFFRKDKSKGLPIWQLIVYGVAVFLAQRFV
jgi:hypothetical protein